MRLMCSAFAVLLPLAPALAQEKHTLRLKFAPGQVTHTLQTQEMKMSMNMGDQPMGMSMNTSTWSMAKVAEVKDGAAVIEQTVQRVKGKGDGMMRVDYDSDVAGSKPGALTPQSKQVGQTVKMRIDGSGKVQEVTVPEDLDMAMERAKLDLKQELSQSFTSFPADPIAIGESWTTTMEMPMDRMGSMTGKITNKLIEVKDNVVTFGQKIEFDVSTIKSMAPDAAMEVTKAEGVSKVDLRTGLPVEATMDIEMKMGTMMTMSIRHLTKQVEAPPAKADAPQTGAPKAEPAKAEPPKTGGK